MLSPGRVGDESPSVARVGLVSGEEFGVRVIGLVAGNLRFGAENRRCEHG